jgi:hypothetical protein
MRHAILWTVVLLGLPQVAAADGASGAAVPPVFPGVESAIERAGTPASPASPSLDLRFNPAQLPPAQHPPSGTPDIQGDWSDRGTEQDAADRGLSFGLEVKQRSRMGALARQQEAEDPDLGGQLERLLERPVVGLRGRYRF